MSRERAGKGIFMLEDAFHGFCMAMADSVPGVSGGTVAFIMGFYDRFIDSVRGLKPWNKDRKKAFLYLARLGFGWVIGMGLALSVLAGIFESQIYLLSSLFIGFIAGSLPIIYHDEKETLREWNKGVFPFLFGLLLVILLALMNRSGAAAIDMSTFNPVMAVRLFLIGAAAISAMFLPGISGSTILMIFGAYIPAIKAAGELMHFHFQYLPDVIVFGTGILTGAVLVSRAISAGLKKFRPQMICFIIGMMIGSFYAIVMGPTTLDNPLPALGLSSFRILPCAVGILLVLGMEAWKNKKAVPKTEGVSA